MIEAINRVGRREIETRWESVKGLGDEEGFNRMVEYLSMRHFWGSIGGSLKHFLGKQRVGEGVKNFIEKVRIFAKSWDGMQKIKRCGWRGYEREEKEGEREVD